MAELKYFVPITKRESFLTESLKVMERQCWTYDQCQRTELPQSVHDRDLVNIDCIFIKKVGLEWEKYLLSMVFLKEMYKLEHWKIAK